MPLAVLGLDVGGANLKAAHSCGVARLFPFELWKRSGELQGALQELIQPMPGFDVLAVTMTGELCDCFENRRQGVHAILNAVAAIANGRRTEVWSNAGHFLELTQARKLPLRAAAANWLALAAFAAPLAATGSALLVDVGSTTTDIVPLHDGKPVPRAVTDRRRLRTRELVYTGVRRTPVCAVLGSSVAAELFATTLDAYLILGKIPEDCSAHATADGRPATVCCARSRLARLLCSDAQSCPEAILVGMANKVLAKQSQLLATALGNVAQCLPEAPRMVVVAGSGEFLAEQALSRSALAEVPRTSLSVRLGRELSVSAPAYAVAMLAREYLLDGR